MTATIETIKDHYPTLKHPEITTPKSGLSNAVGMALTLVLDTQEQNTCLATLDSIDNVLFVVEE